jgi:hypothetical protein
LFCFQASRNQHCSRRYYSFFDWSIYFMIMIIVLCLIVWDRLGFVSFIQYFISFFFWTVFCSRLSGPSYWSAELVSDLTDRTRHLFTVVFYNYSYTYLQWLHLQFQDIWFK